MVNTTIIKGWFTQHCEDAEDLEGYKKIHLHTYWLASFQLKNLEKVEKF